MGNFLFRSASRKKTRLKRKERSRGKRLEEPDATETIDYLDLAVSSIHHSSTVNRHDQHEWIRPSSPEEFIDRHADAPGAPTSYPSTYSLPGNEQTNQPRFSPSQESNNDQFQSNAHSSTQVSQEEPRNSKKTQSSRQVHQQASAWNTSQMTQSWHESTAINNEFQSNAVRAESNNNQTRHFHRPFVAIPASISAPTQKPIYVGIDHEATVAERTSKTSKKKNRNPEKRATAVSMNFNEKKPSNSERRNQQQPVVDHADTPDLQRSSKGNKNDEDSKKKSSKNQHRSAAMTFQKSRDNPERVALVSFEPAANRTRDHNTLVDLHTLPSHATVVNPGNVPQRQTKRSKGKQINSEGHNHNSTMRSELSGDLRRSENPTRNVLAMKTNIDNQPVRNKKISGLPSPSLNSTRSRT